MTKNLPIQLVKTRGEQDTFLKEAGGSDALPSWTSLKDIQENANRLVNELDSISGHFQNRTIRNSQLPLLVKAQLNERATAKSYRPNVRAILNQNRKLNVIGMAGFREVLVKIDGIEDIKAIREAIVSVAEQKSSKDKPLGVASIENLSVFACKVNEDELANKLIKVQLVDYKDSTLNRLSAQMLIELGRELGYNIEKLQYADDLIIFKVNHPSADAIRQIATMDSVISIKAMPYYELVAAPNPSLTNIELAKPVEGEEYPILGILDSGVEQSEYLSSWRLGNEYNTAGLDDFDISRIHGTMVTSIAVYGDILEGKRYTGCGPLKYVSCIVNSDRNGISITEDELIIYIRKAIQRFPDVKIWNLSQGSSLEVSDYEFSDFAKALDDIQKKNNILICKSAGNCSNQVGRITSGAESVLALTVGSICNEGLHYKDLQEGLHSPFSRIGYGPEGLIKPEIVHYGGNIHTGVKVLTGADIQHIAWGTSFATPRVASLATHLYHRLGQPFNSTLIKALIVHNSNYPTSVDTTVAGYEKMYGFGVPTTINEMLNNDEDEFTMVWQPDFSNGTDFQIINFPYPRSLVDENNNLYGIVVVTIVTDPVLKSGEGNEYCQTDIEVKLGPVNHIAHCNIGAIETPKTYRNENRIQLNNILTEDKYSKCQPKLMRERNLILKNHKWQPIKKYQVDLSTMRPVIKNDLRGRDTWAMVIKSFTRDATTLDLHDSGIINDIKATIIITIRDPKNKGLVYNEGIRLLDSHNFEHSNIEVNNDIQLLGSMDI